MRTLFLVLVVAAVGCKGKPKHQAPPNVEQPTGSDDNKERPAPDLKLPSSDGTPPPKSTKPIDAAMIDKLSKMTFPGFQLSVRGHTDNSVELRQLTADHPKIQASISISQCLDCVAMDLEKWKAKEATLKELLGELKDKPDVTWELGKTELFGQDMIFTYQLGQSFTDKGGTYSDAYTLYYNDGINQIRIVSEYKDDPVKTAADMAKMAPKGDLEKVAKAFLDVYTHAW